MDTDKIKVFGSRVKVERVSQVAEIELAEKEKMKDKVGNKYKISFQHIHSGASVQS